MQRVEEIIKNDALKLVVYLLHECSHQFDLRRGVNLQERMQNMRERVRRLKIVSLERHRFRGSLILANNILYGRFSLAQGRCDTDQRGINFLSISEATECSAGPLVW